MTKLLWLVVFILDIWAIINVLQSAAKPIEKALWIVLILVLPFIGLIIWYFAGPGRKKV